MVIIDKKRDSNGNDNNDQIKILDPVYERFMCQSKLGKRHAHQKKKGVGGWRAVKRGRKVFLHDEQQKKKKKKIKKRNFKDK